MKSKKFTLEGYDYKEKVVAPFSGTSAKVYLPKSWEGKRIAIILLEE